MTDADMEAICGANSILGYSTTTIYDNIQHYYNFKGTIDV